jgi:hypothetical protein
MMKHYDRGFLNIDEGMAAFETHVRTSSEWRHNGGNDYMDAGIALSDCSRKIYLEFDSSTRQQLEERKHKVALLLKVVQQFHDKFMEGADSLVFAEENTSGEEF